MALSWRDTRASDIKVARLSGGGGSREWKIWLLHAFETRVNVGSFLEYTMTPFYFSVPLCPASPFQQTLSRGRLTILRCRMLTKGWKFFRVLRRNGVFFFSEFSPFYVYILMCRVLLFKHSSGTGLWIESLLLENFILKSKFNYTRSGILGTYSLADENRMGLSGSGWVGEIETFPNMFALFSQSKT